MPTFEAKMAPGYLLVVAGVKWVLWPKSHWNFRKVSRTIADLAGLETIASEHVMEAVQFRALDQQIWT